MITGIISEGRIRNLVKGRIGGGEVFQAGILACVNVHGVSDQFHSRKFKVGQGGWSSERGRVMLEGCATIDMVKDLETFVRLIRKVLKYFSKK